MSLSLTDPLNPNAPEFIPEAEQQRRANRANNVRSFNEMMREINAGRSRNLGPSSRKNRKSRKTRKNRKSRKNRR
jgi:hypothetical protein